MREISVQIVEGEDISQILRLLREAAIWLQERNINYWKVWINPPDNYVNWIRKGINNKEFYLIKEGSSIIGCFRLSWHDEIFWGKQSMPAGYVHSFTIDRKHYGKKKGIVVLQMIEKKSKDNGKRYLRLDCASNNLKLKKYYEKFGFRPVGVTIVKGEQLTLYERDIV
jgi:ribosomal protein S18 acetylase RimI-like enzyme